MRVIILLTFKTKLKLCFKTIQEREAQGRGLCNFFSIRVKIWGEKIQIKGVLIFEKMLTPGVYFETTLNY